MVLPTTASDIERVQAYLALEELELHPIRDGLDPLRVPEDRGKHIVAYALHDVGAKRGKVGVVSLTMIRDLARMHPARMALALCLGQARDSYARRRRRRGGL